MNLYALAIATMLAAAAPQALAQGAAAFGNVEGAPANVGNGDLDASEGLQSATPTDSVNELNGNGSPASFTGAEQGEGDFPAAEGGADFDISNTGDQTSGGNGVFDEGPVNVGGGKEGDPGAISAFGDNGDTGAAAAGVPNAKSAGGETNPFVEPVPDNQLTGNPGANPQAFPAQPAANALGGEISGQQSVPANAAALMNQIAAPANAPGNATQAQARQSAAESAATPSLQSSAGAEGLAAPKASPLPPPNEFSGAPPVPGTARLMAEGEAPEEYVVEQGDTLYDIVDQLLDEPGYWPKLWSLNPEIKNPHFIFPGMRLKFYPGDDDTPPYLQVVTEDDVIPIDKGTLDEEQLVAETVQIEEEAAPEPPIVEVIGPEDVEDPPELADLILTGGRLYDGSDVQVQVPGFIFAQEKDALAFVIGGRAGEVSLGLDQRALLESTGGVAAGTLYTVLRPGEQVVNPDTGDVVGYKYYFIANMRVEKALEDNVYIGKVESTRLTVRPNDVLVSFIATNRTIPSGESVGSLSSVPARVVGFQFSQQEIGGQGDYAFIDKGNGDGVSPGMYLPILSTPGYLTSASGNSELPEDYEAIGAIRIIDVTDAGAVGYVVRNSKELRIGDRTGRG